MTTENAKARKNRLARERRNAAAAQAPTPLEVIVAEDPTNFSAIVAQVQAEVDEFGIKGTDYTGNEPVDMSVPPKAERVDWDGNLLPGAEDIVPAKVAKVAKVTNHEGDRRVQGTKEYALEHYNDGEGWDVVVETMDDEAVFQIIKGSQGEPGAIKKMTAYLAARAGYAAEIVSA